MLHGSGARRCRQLAKIPLCALLLAVSLPGCYYVQAVHGQFGIWNKTRPLEEVIDDPATASSLRTRLTLLRDARNFATEQLLLPDNGSYRKYADLERDYVVWNVVATPEFSLYPRTWCYLAVGCLAYRGYFSAAAADKFARKLEANGYDVHVGGVPAYSTLGRFDDPLLNTMMQRDDTALVALLFHELAHQHLFLKDDTAFNESFATAVAEFGLEEWFTRRGDTAAAQEWRRRQAAAAAMMRLVDETRAGLARLYRSELPDEEKRSKKEALFESLRTRLSDDTTDQSGWNLVSMNNAWLATMSLYRGNLPAFRRVFSDCGRDWSCFYDAVDAIATLSADERAQSLLELAES